MKDNLTTILTMNSNQICLLLENHKMFSCDEIKLAARMKVKNDKQIKVKPLSDLQYDGLSQYSRQSNDLFGRYQQQDGLSRNIFGGLL